MIRDVVIWPDSILSRPAEPVTTITPEVKQLLDDMEETMLFLKGRGLAAPQVGFSLRLVTLLVADPKSKAQMVLKLINPKITERSAETALMREGCLSTPEYFEMVRRHTSVKVDALDETGTRIELGGGGPLAHALQHELEHLDGVMFIDHLSVLKRNLAHRRFKKAKASGMRYNIPRPEPQDFTQPV